MTGTPMHIVDSAIHRCFRALAESDTPLDEEIIARYLHIKRVERETPQGAAIRNFVAKKSTCQQILGRIILETN